MLLHLKEEWSLVGGSFTRRYERFEKKWSWLKSGVIPYQHGLSSQVPRFSSVQFSPLTDWVIKGTWVILQGALVSSSSMGRGVHSMMLSILYFLCQPRRRPLSKVPREMVLKRFCRGAWHARTMQVSLSGIPTSNCAENYFTDSL